MLDASVTVKAGIGILESLTDSDVIWRSKALPVLPRPFGGAQSWPLPANVPVVSSRDHRSTKRARFDTAFLGTVCVLGISGEIDLFNSPALEDAIAGAAQGHEGVVLVSFVDCTFADCSCLSVLIRQFRKLAARLLFVAPPRSALGRILDITKLTSALPGHGSLREAYLSISSYPRESLGDLAMWAQAR